MVVALSCLRYWVSVDALLEHLTFAREHLKRIDFHPQRYRLCIEVWQPPIGARSGQVFNNVGENRDSVRRTGR